MQRVILTIFAVVFSSACAMNVQDKENINNWNGKASVDMVQCIGSIKRSGSTALTNNRKKLAKIQLPYPDNQSRCLTALNYINSNYGNVCNFDNYQISTLMEEINSMGGKDVYKYIVKQRVNDIANTGLFVADRAEEGVLKNDTINNCFNTDNLLAATGIKGHFSYCYDMLNFAKKLIDCNTIESLALFCSNFSGGDICIEKFFFCDVVYRKLENMSAMHGDNPLNMFFNKSILEFYCKNIWHIDAIDSNNIFFLDDDRVATFADLINTDQVSMDTATNDLHSTTRVLALTGNRFQYLQRHLLKKILLFTCLLKESSDEVDDLDFFKTIKSCNIAHIELEQGSLESLMRFDVALSKQEIGSFFRKDD